MFLPACYLYGHACCLICFVSYAPHPTMSLLFLMDSIVDIRLQIKGLLSICEPVPAFHQAKAPPVICLVFCPRYCAVSFSTLSFSPCLSVDWYTFYINQTIGKYHKLFNQSTIITFFHNSIFKQTFLHLCQDCAVIGYS